MSAGAHSRTRKISKCDWLRHEQGQNDNPNLDASCINKEFTRNFGNDEEWIVVRKKYSGRHVNVTAMNVRHGTCASNRRPNTIDAQKMIGASNTNESHQVNSYDNEVCRRERNDDRCQNKAIQNAKKTHSIVKLIVQESG